MKKLLYFLGIASILMSSSCLNWGTSPNLGGNKATACLNEQTLCRDKEGTIDWSQYRISSIKSSTECYSNNCTTSCCNAYAIWNFKNCPVGTTHDLANLPNDGFDIPDGWEKLSTVTLNPVTVASTCCQFGNCGSAGIGNSVVSFKKITIKKIR
jgi:hypothetical protein